MRQALIISAILFFIYGCKKGPGNEQNVVCRISTIYIPAFQDTFHITYNSEGKVSSIKSDTTTSTYFYSGNTISITKLVKGVYSGRTVVTTNAEGLAINVKTELNASGSEWTNSTYEYNGEEIFRATHTRSEGGDPQILVYGWVNDNIVSIKIGGSVIKLEYYTDKPRQDGDYFSTTSLLAGYELFRTKNLLRSLAGDVVTYDFRTDGKISTVSFNSETVFKYDYECK